MLLCAEMNKYSVEVKEEDNKWMTHTEPWIPSPQTAIISLRQTEVWSNRLLDCDLVQMLPLE